VTVNQLQLTGYFAWHSFKSLADEHAVQRITDTPLHMLHTGNKFGRAKMKGTQKAPALLPTESDGILPIMPTRMLRGPLLPCTQYQHQEMRHDGNRAGETNSEVKIVKLDIACGYRPVILLGR
jgi:hypothetical protein